MPSGLALLLQDGAPGASGPFPLGRSGSHSSGADDVLLAAASHVFDLSVMESAVLLPGDRFFPALLSTVKVNKLGELSKLAVSAAAPEAGPGGRSPSSGTSGEEGPSTAQAAQLKDTRHGRIGPSIVEIDAASWSGRLSLGANGLTVESLANFSSFRAIACVFTGKWMYEVTVLTSGIQQIGWATLQCPFTPEEGVGDAPDSYAYDGKRVKKWSGLNAPVRAQPVGAAGSMLRERGDAPGAGETRLHAFIQPCMHACMHMHACMRIRMEWSCPQAVYMCCGGGGMHALCWRNAEVLGVTSSARWAVPGI